VGAKIEQLWIVTSEIVVQKGDFPSGNTNAFVNVVGYADSPELAERKVARCLQSYGWQVAGMEACRPVDDSETYQEDIADIIDQVRANPGAVIYGRMFSSKPD